MQKKRSKAVHLLTLLAFALERLPHTPVLQKPGKAVRTGSQGKERCWISSPQQWQHPGKAGDCLTAPQVARPGPGAGAGLLVGNSHLGFTFAVPTWNRVLKCCINGSFAGQVIYREGL